MMRARTALVRRACVFSLLQLTHMAAVQELSDGPACGNVTRGLGREPVLSSGADWRGGSGVLTRKSGSEVLLVHRSPKQGGYWHVVAGGVEPGESEREAAKRELREETGLVADAVPGVEVVEYVSR